MCDWGGGPYGNGAYNPEGIRKHAEGLGAEEIKEEIKDLRGKSVREVHRDDVVIITGAEYLRKSRLAAEAEFRG